MDARQCLKTNRGVAWVLFYSNTGGPVYSPSVHQAYETRALCVSEKAGQAETGFLAGFETFISFIRLPPMIL
ncbi:MAG TPA: hypothetical protein VNY55_08170, partial [Mycobacterium sp.]|nr:hypothetical protein [Mycobacterium sp.]